MIIAVYYLIRSFSNFTKGYEYTGLPYTQELENWYLELKEFYKASKGKKNKHKKEFESYIRNSFVKHSEHNMFVIDKKYYFIYMSKKFLIISIVLGFIILMPYGFNHFLKGESISKIEIVNVDAGIKKDKVSIIEKTSLNLDSIITNNNE